MNRLDGRLARAAAAWVNGARRRAAWVIGLAALATLGSLALARQQLELNADTDAMLSSQLGFRQLEAELDHAFPTRADNLLIVIDAATPEEARDAARRLAGRLAQHQDRFRSVFVPGGGRFFEQHALLYLDVDSLEELADRLAEAQPFLAELSRDPTLGGLSYALSRALDAVRSGDFEASELPALLDGMAQSFETALAGKRSSFSWEEWIVGPEAASGRRQLVIVQPVLEFGSLGPAQEALRIVRSEALGLGLTPDQGVRVRVTGVSALSTEEMEIISRQTTVAGLAAFGLVAVLLLLALRSVRLVLATLATLIAGLAWTTAFATLALGQLNLISATFAVLFIGLGIDFGIHFGARYQELLASGAPAGEALRESGRTVGSSLLLCSATTAIGFYAFVPTQYAGVAELGLIAGTGMFLSLIATLTLLPALLACLPIRPRRRHGFPLAPARWIAALPERRPRWVLAVSGALGGLALLALPAVRFDGNPLSVRDPSAESVQTMWDLLAEGESSPWPAELLASDRQEAQRLVRRFEALPVVDRAVSLFQYVPDEQDEKLGILEDISLFLGPLAVDGADEAIDADRVRSRLVSLQHSLQAISSSAAHTELHASGQRLEAAVRRVLARLDAASRPETELARLDRSVLGDLRGWLRRLETALSANRVAESDLPAELRQRYVAADGRLRLEVFPSEDLNDPARLEHFVDSVQAAAPQAAGAAVAIVESARAVVSSLRQALGTAVVTIGVLLWALWRRLSDAALVLAPLLLAALWTAAASVALNLPFNFADVIVLPLLLGVGVDSGIHLVHRYRMGTLEGGGLLQTSTARAVVFSALTTIASFATLGFSSHRGMSSLGRLLTLGIGFTLLANLLVLPALLSWLAGRSRPRPSAARAGAPS